jgi:hypothetical protein
MNEKMNNINKSKIISDCKQMYCNPKCSYIRKNLPDRYICPICKEQSEKAKKLGAITQCNRDIINL